MNSKLVSLDLAAAASSAVEIGPRSTIVDIAYASTSSDAGSGPEPVAYASPSPVVAELAPAVAATSVTIAVAKRLDNDEANR